MLHSSSPFLGGDHPGIHGSNPVQGPSFFSFIKITGKLVKEIFLSVPGRDKSIFKVVDKFKELKSNCQFIYIEKKKIALSRFLGLKLDIFFHLKPLNY